METMACIRKIAQHLEEDRRRSRGKITRTLNENIEIIHESHTQKK